MQREYESWQDVHLFFYIGKGDSWTISICNGTQRDEEIDFAQKADDDAFVHVPNLVKRLQSLTQPGMNLNGEMLTRIDGVYLGRICPVRPTSTFKCGMGYVLSWDLVDWISSNPFAFENRIGVEDQRVDLWVRTSGKLKQDIKEGPDLFYDSPGSGALWAHDYTPNTIVIHQLKNTTLYLQAAAHFVLSD